MIFIEEKSKMFKMEDFLNFDVEKQQSYHYLLKKEPMIKDEYFENILKKIKNKIDFVINYFNELNDENIFDNELYFNEIIIFLYLCALECKTIIQFLEINANMDVLKDLQILTPVKKTELGTIQLNDKIQEILNPESKEKRQVSHNGKIFRENDKVMQIVNNYDKKYSIEGKFFEGIYNGDIGYIDMIDKDEEKLYVLFDDDRLVEYDFDELDQLEHSYAITIHKSQGSEFDYVILPIFTGYKKLLSRNLLYTAMTRAKKMLIIVGNRNVVNYMVDNLDSKNRKTGLREKIEHMLYENTSKFKS
jgi:hypothetical protein